MENFKNSPFVKKVGFNRIVLCGVLLVMYIAFAIISPVFKLFPNPECIELCLLSRIPGIGSYLCDRHRRY